MLFPSLTVSILVRCCRNKVVCGKSAHSLILYMKFNYPDSTWNGPKTSSFSLERDLATTSIWCLLLPWLFHKLQISFDISEILFSRLLRPWPNAQWNGKIIILDIFNVELRLYSAKNEMESKRRTLSTQNRETKNFPPIPLCVVWVMAASSEKAKFQQKICFIKFLFFCVISTPKKIHPNSPPPPRPVRDVIKQKRERRKNFHTLKSPPTSFADLHSIRFHGHCFYEHHQKIIKNVNAH